MQGQVVFITGAGSGIGRAAARLFAESGATLALCDVDEASGAEALAEVRALGVPASFERCDVSKASDVRGAVEGVVHRFGRLNHAFNNAGIAGPALEINKYPEDAWDQVLRVNLTGVWLCMKFEIDQMLEQGGGTIVNVSSIAGSVAYWGGAAYIAAKHGVLGITKAAALEHAASGIRVNAVCPGYVATPMILGEADGQRSVDTMTAYATLHPIGRLGTPDEIARVVLWLCSEAPDFLNGHGLVVDGGYTVQ